MTNSLFDDIGMRTRKEHKASKSRRKARYAFCCFFCRKYILNNMIVFDFLVIYDIML